jgi:hypothetical protein
MFLWVNGYDTAGFTHASNTRSDVVMSLRALVQSLDNGSEHNLPKQLVLPQVPSSASLLSSSPPSLSSHCPPSQSTFPSSLTLSSPLLPQDHPTMVVKYSTDAQGITVRSATDHSQGCRWAALKATCIVDNCTHDEMLEFLCNIDRVPEYDSMMDKRGCTLVETQGREWLFGGETGQTKGENKSENASREEDEQRNAEIRRCHFKAVWPTDPRDFCILSSWSKYRTDCVDERIESVDPAEKTHHGRVWDKAAGSYPLERSSDFEKLPLGSYVISSRSIEHTKMQKQKGFVRGFLISSGWVIKPVPGCPDKCHIGIHALSDPGSSESLAPIINAVAVKAPVKCLQNVMRIAKEAHAQGRHINALPSNPQASQ